MLNTLFIYVGHCRVLDGPVKVLGLNIVHDFVSGNIHPSFTRPLKPHNILCKDRYYYIELVYSCIKCYRN